MSHDAVRIRIPNTCISPLFSHTCVGGGFWLNCFIALRVLCFIALRALLDCEKPVVIAYDVAEIIMISQRMISLENGHTYDVVLCMISL